MLSSNTPLQISCKDNEPWRWQVPKKIFPLDNTQFYETQKEPVC